MKKRLLLTASIFLVFFLLIASGDLYSQTSGTLSFTVTTTPPTGSYSGEYLFASWIENNAGAFVMTKWKYTGGETDHLTNWVAKSARNGVGADANSGATLSGGQTITWLWNGTNTSGTVVSDGDYKVWTEMEWGKNKVEGTDKVTTSYTITKGVTRFTLNPANTTYYNNVSLVWQPLTTGIEGTLETRDFNIYPNPSSGLLKIDFKKSAADCTVQIINNAGQVVYTEKLTDIQEGTRTLNLTSLNAGNYLCVLHFPGNDVVFNVILVK
jgi:flagellar hook assembly protein FlgD